MDSFISMKQKLEPLGLYDLDGSGEAVCELKSYAEGLDVLFDTLDELEREYFIPTAESFGLSRRESFINRERSDLSAPERRDELLYLEKSVGDLTDSGFAEFLSRLGLTDYTLDVDCYRAKIEITIYDQKTDGEKAFIQKRIRAEIPAHMTLTITYSQ